MSDFARHSHFGVTFWGNVSMIQSRYAAVFVGLLFVLAGGCAQKAVLPIAPGPTSEPTTLITDRARIQDDLMNLVDDYMGAVIDVYNEIESRATTPEKTLFVQTRRANSAQAALSNAVNPQPLTGMMDMLVMIRLSRQVAEEAWVREVLGDDTDLVIRTLSAQEETMWRVAGRYVSDEQLAELRELIVKWRQKNPQQRFVAEVRMVDFVEGTALPGESHRSPNSILGLLFLDPLAGIDPAVREIERSRDTAERMFYYTQRMPMLISWQLELLYRRMLSEPQLNRMFTDMTAFSNASAGFAKASLGFADSVEAFRKQISAEREQAIDQIGKLVAVERDAAIRQATTQVSTLREQAVDQLNLVVAAQRDSVIAQATTRVSAEREAAIAQATTRISAEREAAIDQFMKSTQNDLLTTLKQTELAMERSIDRFYSRMRNLAILTVGAIFVMLVAYRLLFRATARERSLVTGQGEV